MNNHCIPRTILAAAALAGAVTLFFSARPALALAVDYSSGHGDIGVGYDAGAFEPHWHLAAGAIVDGSPLLLEEEYAPAAARAIVTATRTSPTGLSPLIGLPDGSTIWAAGSAAYQPNLGFAVEELNPIDWVGNITLTLTSWVVPSGAHFALYRTNGGGTTVTDKVFSTLAPGVTDDTNSYPYFVAGDHEHFQFGFTAPGTYALTFDWSGTHTDDGAISTAGTFSFEVVPEPSSVLLLGASALAWAGVRRRR